MGDMLDENEDAVRFVTEVAQRADVMKLFPEERFASVIFGVLMTTTVDSHGEQFTIEALEALERKVKENVFLVTAHHDPRIQPVGRVLAAKTFFAPKSKAHFVAGVVGYWDVSTFMSFEKMGINVSGADNFDVVPNIEIEGPLEAHVGVTRQDFDFAELEALLSEAPPIVSKRVQQEFRKAEDPMTIVTISASIALLLSTPYLKEIQKRFGAATADASLAFLRWVGSSLAAKVRSMAKREVLFELKSEIDGCDLAFLVETSDPLLVSEAMEKVQQAAVAAIKLATCLSAYGPIRITYLYDHVGKKWLPLFAVTKQAGIVTDRPRLIALEGLSGISVAGVLTDRTHIELSH